MEAIGGGPDLGVNSEALFHPAYPYESSITGETTEEFCDAYQKASGKQWTQTIGGCYAGYEIVYDVLKRAQTLDKDASCKAFIATDLETLQGRTISPRTMWLSYPPVVCSGLRGISSPSRVFSLPMGTTKCFPLRVSWSQFENYKENPEIRVKTNHRSRFLVFSQENREPFHEVFTIFLIIEYLSALFSPDHNMMQEAGRVQII